jgi:peptidoglycan/LPS O-acetylase OafA/YrhL
MLFKLSGAAWSGEMQNNPAGRITGSRDNYLPALDGLRFTAAMLVAGGHYASNLGEGILPQTLMSFTGLGMTLFFVLSGFVIHYNYQATIPTNGGIRIFAVARFARLYPLYLMLFVIDFSYTGITAHGACGRAGESNGHWLGLINYVTLTQSWYYAVICKSSLVYQYGPVAAVSWSISVEAFFYIVYVGVARLIAQKKWSMQKVLCFSAASYVAVVVYLFLCSHFQSEIDRAGLAVFGPVAQAESGYQDSLLRWLLYFNPIGRLSEFFVGMAAAHLYLMQRSHPAELQPAQASVVTLIFVVAAVAIHLWLYEVIAPGSSYIGRIASPLYGPVIAIMMYLIVRYDTFCSRGFSNSILVRFGEASYSIYLLHEILPSVFSRLGLVASDQWSRWLMWSGSLLLLAIISRVSYLYIERPARLVIRARLARKIVQQARYV